MQAIVGFWVLGHTKIKIFLNYKFGWLAKDFLPLQNFKGLAHIVTHNLLLYDLWNIEVRMKER